MSNSPEVKRIPKELIKVGTPISYPVYDAKGTLLMQAGTIIETEGQLEKLYERGLYLDQKSSEHLRQFGKPGGKANFESNEVKQEASQPEGEVLVELPFKSLKVGETLQASPLADDSGSIKYLIKYIGGLDKKSLICTLPTIDDKVVFIKENSGLSVRLFSGKNVYRFNTMVDVVFSRPFPHMHLKFPREVYSNRLRKNQRVSVNIIVSMLNKSQPASENSKTAGRLVDLSLGGSLIEAYKSGGYAGDIVECTFKINLDGGEALFVIPGVLRAVSNTVQADGRKLFRHGVQFNEIAFQDKIILQSYIFQALTGEKLDDL